MDTEPPIAKALKATKESRSIEFKEVFDVTSQRDWCEIIKDIVAIANTDGGVILIGVDNKGKAAKFNVKPILEIDPADIVNKIHKYTNVHFLDIEITEERKGARKIAALRIKRSPTPIVFSKPGTYDIGGGKQGRAFSEGTVYFRHGAKSEPGTTEDIRRAIDKRVAYVRKEMIKGVKKVVTAPIDSKVVVMPTEVVESEETNATPIRIVDDPSAPAFRKVDPGKSHPYLIDTVASEIKKAIDGLKLGRYEILGIRHVENLNEATRPDLIYRDTVHKSTSPQYSEAFVKFVRQRLKDPNYLNETVKKYKAYVREKALGKRKR